MGLANYNGWRGFVREKRQAVFYKGLREKTIVVGPECRGCGATPDEIELGPHSEEYGSTPQHYIDSCLTLCIRCHAVVHIRYSYPQVWSRYLTRVANGEQLPYFPRMTAVFQSVFRHNKREQFDPDKHPLPETGTWLDNLSPERYKGPDKLAVIEQDGEYVPDPHVYKNGLAEGDYLIVGPEGEQLYTYG